jgi:hypothetical protein
MQNPLRLLILTFTGNDSYLHWGRSVTAMLLNGNGSRVAFSIHTKTYYLFTRDSITMEELNARINHLQTNNTHEWLLMEVTNPNSIFLENFTTIFQKKEAEIFLEGIISLKQEYLEKISKTNVPFSVLKEIQEEIGKQ